MFSVIGKWKIWFHYDRIRYLISVKSGIANIFSHNYATIKVDSYNPLPLERATFSNFVILVKSVWNKDKNNYYYMFLEKASYELPEK